jgi:hypothetical protein
MSCTTNLWSRPTNQRGGNLIEPGRLADRPPTWVPLVFHCTTLDRVPAIVESGQIEPGRSGAISFSEAPIGELDRMKYRHHGADQVAFGYPRRFLETLGFAPVLYAKYDQPLRRALAAIRTRAADLYTDLAPFVEDASDVSPFQEIRTRSAVPLDGAVWILTTRRKENTQLPDVPGLKPFKAKFGRIATSYWHRTHQMEMLGEWQHLTLKTGSDGWPVEFEFIGEHYWEQRAAEVRSLTVMLPAHDRQLDFRLIARRQSRMLQDHSTSLMSREFCSRLSSAPVKT